MRGLFFILVGRLLIAAASLVGAAQWLWHMGLTAMWPVESSQTRDRTHVPSIDRQILTHGPQGSSPKLFSVVHFIIRYKECDVKAAKLENF